MPESLEEAIRTFQANPRERSRLNGLVRGFANPSAAPVLTGPLRDPDPEVRLFAARILVGIADRQPLCLLATSLADPDPRVREFALVALDRLGNPWARGKLREALLDPSAEVRKLAARRLGESEPAEGAFAVPAPLPDAPEGVGELTAALANPHPFVRERAAHRLGWLRYRPAFEDLIGRLEDPEASVRGAAATALAWIGDRRAQGPLIAALEDEAFWSAAGDRASGLEAVAAALGALGDMGVVAAVMRAKIAWVKDTALQQAVDRVIEREGPQSAFGMLLEGLHGVGGAVAASARWLGRLGDPRAEAPLLEALRRCDQEVRGPLAHSAVCEALGAVAGPDAFSILLRRLVGNLQPVEPQRPSQDSPLELALTRLLERHTREIPDRDLLEAARLLHRAPVGVAAGDIYLSTRTSYSDLRSAVMTERRRRRLGWLRRWVGLGP